jgi:hypothetical protein
MAVDRQMIEFTPDDIGAVVEQVGGLIQRGAGWLNIEPIVGEVAMDEIRRSAAPAIVRVFSGRGGKIPFGTFVPGDNRKAAMGQVGLEHSAGPRGLQQLRDAGVGIARGVAHAPRPRQARHRVRGAARRRAGGHRALDPRCGATALRDRPHRLVDSVINLPK